MGWGTGVRLRLGGAGWESVQHAKAGSVGNGRHTPWRRLEKMTRTSLPISTNSPTGTSVGRTALFAQCAAMPSPEVLPERRCRWRKAALRPVRMFLALVLFFQLWGSSLRAELQFDVFLGYDGIVREAGWFPTPAKSSTMACVQRRRRDFQRQHAGGSVAAVSVGTPYQHRKRFVIPCLLPAGASSNECAWWRRAGARGAPNPARKSWLGRASCWPRFSFVAGCQSAGSPPNRQELRCRWRAFCRSVARQSNCP